MNLSKIQEDRKVAASKLKAATGASGKYFKATEGPHNLRLVDCFSDNPFIMQHINYKLAKNPFCVEDEKYLTQHAWDYYSKDDDEQSERRKMFRSIMPSTRYFTQVLDLDNVSAGVKIWSMSKTTHDKLMLICEQSLEQGVDPTSHAEGLNLKLTVTKTGAFPVSEVNFGFKTCALPEGVVVKKEDLHDIKALSTYKTEAEVKELMDSITTQGGDLPF